LNNVVPNVASISKRIERPKNYIPIYLLILIYLFTYILIYLYNVLL
jgi:hypothetical protein